MLILKIQPLFAKWGFFISRGRAVTSQQTAHSAGVGE